MAETVYRNGKKIFADKIRMLAKSIYDAADDIAGTTDGCVEISVSFDIETESAEFPTYTITRRHYPQRKVVEEFFDRLANTAETEEKRPASIDPVTYKDLLDNTNVVLRKSCKTCLYENDIDHPYCATCFRNPDLVDHTHCVDNWRGLKEAK